jgi:hypothetical protein
MHDAVRHRAVVLESSVQWISYGLLNIEAAVNVTMTNVLALNEDSVTTLEADSKLILSGTNWPWQFDESGTMEFKDSSVAVYLNNGVHTMDGDLSVGVAGAWYINDEAAVTTTRTSWNATL